MTDDIYYFLLNNNVITLIGENRYVI